MYPTRSVYRKMFVAAGYTPQEIDTVSDSFIESLLVFPSDQLFLHGLSISFIKIAAA
jgi:hypothetical protein